MSRYYDVSFKAVIEADSYEHACERAKEVAQAVARPNLLRSMLTRARPYVVNSQLNAELGAALAEVPEIGGWFCGMDWAGDADDADPGVPEMHGGPPCGFPSSVTDATCVLPVGHEADNPFRFHRFASAPAKVEGTNLYRTSDGHLESNACGSCGADLNTDEHDADCKFYSYGGEDGRDG